MRVRLPRNPVKPDAQRGSWIWDSFTVAVGPGVLILSHSLCLSCRCLSLLVNKSINKVFLKKFWSLTTYLGVTSTCEVGESSVGLELPCQQLWSLGFLSTLAENWEHPLKRRVNFEIYFRERKQSRKSAQAKRSSGWKRGDWENLPPIGEGLLSEERAGLAHMAQVHLFLWRIRHPVQIQAQMCRKITRLVGSPQTDSGRARPQVLSPEKFRNKQEADCQGR